MQLKSLYSPPGGESRLEPGTPVFPCYVKTFGEFYVERENFEEFFRGMQKPVHS